ncbi:MAG: hypothetical protein LBP35_01925 [Candidatus Ancillula trichonymphae]|nr:hypothetical protein [Candidatus Ancillula trichonymphae]
MHSEWDYNGNSFAGTNYINCLDDRDYNHPRLKENLLDTGTSIFCDPFKHAQADDSFAISIVLNNQALTDDEMYRIVDFPGTLYVPVLVGGYWKKQ